MNESYDKELMRGFQVTESSHGNTLHNKRIVVCGTARNVSKYLKGSVKGLLSAFSEFLEVRIVICESFSTDKTIKVLNALSQEYPELCYFSDGSVPETEQRRTVRIASARNELAKYVRKHHSSFDFVAMVDLDGVNRDLGKKSLRSIIEFQDWDGVFANQPLRYYDIWALRADGWSEGDCWEEYRNLLRTYSQVDAKRLAVTMKMKSIPERTAPIPVRSAFGGLGIYKIDAFLKSEYRGSDAHGEEICEHVFFNETLISKGYKLFIHPALVNLNRQSQLTNLVKETILKLSRKI